MEAVCGKKAIEEYDKTAEIIKKHFDCKWILYIFLILLDLQYSLLDGSQNEKWETAATAVEIHTRLQ